jgi:hypothetical protein
MDPDKVLRVAFIESGFAYSLNRDALDEAVRILARDVPEVQISHIR